MTTSLVPPNLEAEAAVVRKVLASGKTWHDLTIPQRVTIIRDGRAKGLSWRDIAEAVGLKRRNHSTIIQWARGKNGPPEFRKKKPKAKPKHHQQELQLVETEGVDAQTLQEIVRGELESTFKGLDLNNSIGLAFPRKTTLVKIQNHLETLRNVRISSRMVGEELGTTLMLETERILGELVQEITVTPQKELMEETISSEGATPNHLLRELIDQFTDLKMSLKTTPPPRSEIPETQGTVAADSSLPPPPPPPPQGIVPVTLMPPSSAPSHKSRYPWGTMSLESIISLLLEIRQLSDKAERGELSKEEAKELERKELTSEEHVEMEMRLEQLLRSPSFSWEQFETIDAINVIPFSIRQNLDKPQKDAMKDRLVFLSKPKEEQERILQERERIRQAAEAQQANVDEMRNALAKRQKLAHSIGGIHQGDLQRELEKDATSRVTWWACSACEHKFPFISTQKEPNPTTCPLCKVIWWSCDRCEEMFPFMTTGEDLEPPICPICKTKEKGALTVKLKKNPSKTGFVDYGSVVRGSAKIQQEDIKNL
jgi:rubrerythrin/transcriptional regulator with XRE-family HTH domain